MKTYLKNIMLICAIALGAIACTKDEIDTFSGTELLYFQWAVDGQILGNSVSGPKLDSTSMSFAFELPNVTDSVYMVPVKILGKASSTDRPFNLKVLPTSTAVEGVDFTIPANVFIPADSIRAMVPITLIRTPKMKDAPVSIQIGLEPNEYFNTNYFGTSEDQNSKALLKYNEFELTVSDILTEPARWSSLAPWLGDFSAKKLILYATVNNIPIPNWNVNLPDIGLFFARKNVLKAYLIDQKNNGTPVLEDDGTEMKLGPFA
ncbi:DUF4843 domain-containing protein [Snuella sedimenti]|uniref:DUF4843 domain-containing protein n=1 Tax=Snuella sedimenti TaxID=2798802 RepID=A0A8J7LSF7_9FLAO|nr:DUF4843 domain-containing protein [Snuella sedimenti]MBJ6368385.1 DUF4843 domain-containing protein [Snuella sedimenti]